MSFLTILRESGAEYEEKRSRFIGEGFRVLQEQQARQALEKVRHSYPDASHHVYAYVLSSGQTRFSDDGEPSGTAGRPVLSVIQGAGLINVLVVVTRYFGGTLLGTGGLVRAYTRAAQEALKACGTVEVRTFERILVSVSYSDWPKVEYAINHSTAYRVNTVYTEDVEVQLFVPQQEAGRLIQSVDRAAHGSARILEMGTADGWVDQGKLTVL